MNSVQLSATFVDVEMLHIVYVNNSSKRPTVSTRVCFVPLAHITRKETRLRNESVTKAYQILGRALGGKVGRASAGWDIGITKVHLTPSQIFTTLKMPTSLSVIECHRDELWELPPKAEVLAWSDKTGIEMFRCSDHIMGIQGHLSTQRTSCYT
ncbi:UNVERIFIED_CONTAM: Gamma-glutamyl peptidase 2 [Sesamum radiatum]|uniref:Gamma-glutamyl peptidase 2 n=1 Tax=Sesamum radiatum TaxID=300843 RepID=A0AAW2MTZ7_SESRA